MSAFYDARTKLIEHSVSEVYFVGTDFVAKYPAVRCHDLEILRIKIYYMGKGVSRPMI